MRKTVLILASIASAVVIAFAVYLSQAGSGGRTTDETRDTGSTTQSDHTGKPGEVK